MAADPDNPQVLANLPTEAEAALVVNHLSTQGIKARIAGASLGTTWPEGRSDVQVVVRQADLARAKEFLKLVRKGHRENDVAEPK